MARREGKKKSGLLYKLVILILIGIIAFSLYKVGTILYNYYYGARTYKEVAKEANFETEKDEIDWKALKSKYKDIKAWLYLKDTVINYPVVQGTDNSYYLHRLINGEYNFKGTLFIDYRCAKPFKDHMTIIYGHRMKDGTMFKPLIKYREKEFYDSHKKLILYTPDGDYDIEVFAACTIPADSEMYKFDFTGEDDMAAYLEQIYNSTELSTDVQVKPQDKLVMLSTCTYEFDEARLVVYGKMVPRS